MPVAYPVFRAALDSGNLECVIALAREMPPMRLDDALRVVLLMRDGDPDRYDAARARWIGRFALEGRGVTIDDLREAVDASMFCPTNRRAPWSGSRRSASHGAWPTRRALESHCRMSAPKGDRPLALGQ